MIQKMSLFEYRKNYVVIRIELKKTGNHEFLKANKKFSFSENEWLDPKLKGTEILSRYNRNY